MVKPANAQTMTKPSVPEFTTQIQTQANITIITLTIKNQLFEATSQYPDGFFYNVALSVDGKNWSELYHVEDAEDWYPQQSNNSITVLTFVAGETIYYPRDTSQTIGVIPESGEVAFQVQAMIGHRERGVFKNGSIPYVFVGKTSDWSNTQTIIMPASSSSSTPTVNPSPHTPQTFPVLVAALIVIAVVIASILIFNKHRKTANIRK
jgi:hypothetical protein